MAKIVKKKKRKLGPAAAARPRASSRRCRPFYVPKARPLRRAKAVRTGNPVRSMLRIINNYDFKNRSEEDHLARVLRDLRPRRRRSWPSAAASAPPSASRTATARTSTRSRCTSAASSASWATTPSSTTWRCHGVSAEKQSEKIAVVGAGPAGLSCAYQLARKGYQVTVYEAFAKAGGMLRYGIPDYRLPQGVLDAEIQRILDLGVELKTNVRVGRTSPGRAQGPVRRGLRRHRRAQGLQPGRGRRGR